MTLRTPDAYRESLRDGRTVVYRGTEVDDVTKHPALGRTIDHAADLFAASSEAPAELWVHHDPDLDEAVSAFFVRPTDRAQLRARGDLIEDSTRRSGTTLNIVKVVGTDALLGLETVLAPLGSELPYAERVARYRAQCAQEDLAMALAATDAKGDRLRPPAEQHDPDLHLRVVRRTDEGIVVRGAKLHTTAAPSANELIVIPGRGLRPEDADYAVAFAVPVATPGLTLISHPIDPGLATEHPVSSRHVEVETLTVFDDVEVPWERVFLCGEWQHAGPIAEAFANYHRYTAVSYKPPSIDLLIGAAVRAVDQLGLAGRAEVRERIGQMVCYVELIRAARIAAAERADVGAAGLAWPDPLAANAGKYHFASGFHEVVATLQDLAGGIVVTAPGDEDLAHPTYGPLVDKYLAAREGVSGRQRWQLAQLIRDMTATDFGGYNDVVTLHGEGSPKAQLIAATRSFDFDSCTALVDRILDR